MNPSLQAQEYIENDISEESCLATLISPLLECQAGIRSNATCLCKISPSRQHQNGETLLFTLMRINYSFLWAIRSVPFLVKADFQWWIKCNLAPNQHSNTLASLQYKLYWIPSIFQNWEYWRHCQRRYNVMLN